MICNYALEALADLRQLELEHRALVDGERHQHVLRCPRGQSPHMTEPLSRGASGTADLFGGEHP